MALMPVERWSLSERDAVRDQTARIAKSAPFAHSRRRQRFLTYVIDETLAGRGDRLKGYNIAIEVFERGEAFDPNVDPVVRIEAARVRDKLREYYETEGRDDPVRIDLPKGTYAPAIEFRDAAQPVVPSHLDEGYNRENAGAKDAQSESIRWQISALVLLLMAVSILAMGGVLWQREADNTIVLPHQITQDSRARVNKASEAGVPAIAVLPFANLSGEPNQDYFSDGLTEDILTALSRVRDLRVLARNTTFKYKEQADVAKLGRDLKARYVLEGSIQRSSGRLRVTAKLIDTQTGTHIWADRYEREMADLFLVQDDIVNQIVAKIAGSYGVIQNAESKSAARKSADEIQAYDLVLQARAAMQFDWTAETFGAARAKLNAAIALDPLNAQARREFAWFSILGWVFRLDPAPVPTIDFLPQAIKAAQLDPADARAHMVAASAYFFTKQLDLFAHEADQALALAPYDAEIMAVLGCMLSSAGDHQRGVALAKKANAYNPGAATGWYHATVYIASYLNGDYEQALEVARQNQDLEMIYAYIEIIPIFGQLGRKQDARESWRKLGRLVPGASAETFESWWRLWNYRADDMAKMMEGVYKSGVLETASKTGD